MIRMDVLVLSFQNQIPEVTVHWQHQDKAMSKLHDPKYFLINKPKLIFTPLLGYLGKHK